ncbi:MAG: FAD-dependent oxidoreductase, partial [Vicinamibacterales bacterium]
TLYAAAYVATAALSLPGATILTLVGGGVFGFGTGLLLVSFASTIGATLAFLSARWLLREWVQGRFGDHLAYVDAGLARDGALYLLALRLTPLLPFWLVNLAMGLTAVPLTTFYWVSQVGMLPGTALTVYAGSTLAEFRLSAGLLVALTLLALVPLMGARVLDWLRARRVYARWAAARPTRCDYNLVVIGAGSGGLMSAYIAASVRARVAIIEQHRTGGDCLYTGCVPSKALLRPARLLAQLARAPQLGVRGVTGHLDFAAVMERIRQVIVAIEPHDSPERYARLGVEVIQGRARLSTPWTVEVDTSDGPRTLTTRAVVVATGAHPVVPSVPGLAESGYLTSDSLWTLRELPGRLVVLGGGTVGTELGQAFARLGSHVTIVETEARLLAREDPDVSDLVQRRLEHDGVRVLAGHTAIRVLADGTEKQVVVARGGAEQQVPFDALLVATGRSANTAGLGLEALGIATTQAGTIASDDYLQTMYPNILVCGDVAGPLQFTHAAAHQARYAVINALFGTFRRVKADYRVIPSVTFTDPEVARVGLNEADARARGVAHVVTTYQMADLDRAIVDDETEGFVKVLTAPNSDRILGVTIVGAEAGELIAEYVLAMTHGLGLEKILSTVHAYPTRAEANRHAAGSWRRSRVTAGQQEVLAEFHAWRRGASSLLAVLSRVARLVPSTPRAATTTTGRQGPTGTSGTG